MCTDRDTDELRGSKRVGERVERGVGSWCCDLDVVIYDVKKKRELTKLKTKSGFFEF